MGKSLFITETVQELRDLATALEIGLPLFEEFGNEVKILFEKIQVICQGDNENGFDDILKLLADFNMWRQNLQLRMENIGTKENVL